MSGFDEIDRRFARPPAPREIKREAPSAGDPCPAPECRGVMVYRIELGLLRSRPLFCSSCGWQFEEAPHGR